MSLDRVLKRFDRLFKRSTEFSRPPWALRTNPEPKSWDTEDHSTHAKVSHFVQEQITYMSRHPVLWHIKQTLADTEFWELKCVLRTTNGVTSLGYSARNSNYKRLIGWLEDFQKEPIWVKDCAQNGSQCSYGSHVKDVSGYMTINTPSNDVVFDKSISSDALPSTDKLKIAADCDFLTDPLGRDLEQEVKDSMRQVEGPPFPHYSVEEWLYPRD